MFRQSAFASTFETPIRLPMRNSGRTPDVTVTLRRSEREVKEVFRATRESDRLVFEIDAIRFAVSGGSRIDIDAPTVVDERTIRLWLTGTVMAGLLAQQGRLVVHANGLMLPSGGAALVMGESGDGKSTLAAQWLALGRGLLCDDLAAIAFDVDVPTVLAGLERVKLWERDLDLLNGVDCTKEKVAPGIEKYEIAPVGSEPLPDRVSIEAIYLLGKGEGAIEQLSGAQAAAALVDNGFRWEVGQLWHEERWQFDRCLDLAREVPVYRFTRPWDRDRRDESFATLLDHLGA